jgi:hypothetical protein
LVASQYGIGGLLAVAIWSELGDCQRFTRSEQAVRHTGLDVTVDQSDRRRLKGYLSRQGPEILRWVSTATGFPRWRSWGFPRDGHEKSPGTVTWVWSGGRGTSPWLAVVVPGVRPGAPLLCRRGRRLGGLIRLR